MRDPWSVQPFTTIEVDDLTFAERCNMGGDLQAATTAEHGTNVDDRGPFVPRDIHGVAT